jgi:hypothetical protein
VPSPPDRAPPPGSDWPADPLPAPVPTVSRLVLEPQTVVEVRLRTVVRVETTPPTAIPARRFFTTMLEGSS